MWFRWTHVLSWTIVIIDKDGEKESKKGSSQNRSDNQQSPAESGNESKSIVEVNSRQSFLVGAQLKVQRRQNRKGTRMTTTKKRAFTFPIRTKEITFVSFFCQTFSTQFPTNPLIIFDEYRDDVCLCKLERFIIGCAWIRITNQSTSDAIGFENEILDDVDLRLHTSIETSLWISNAVKDEEHL